MTRKAILFPAFVREYSGLEENFVRMHLPQFSEKLNLASEVIECDLREFGFETNNFLNNELKSQYISYIFSCELANHIRKSGYFFDYASGYSMGIYAMFFYTGVYGFEDGLKLIRGAYESVNRVIPPDTFGMGNIIGLDYNDINALIINEEAEIINCNGTHNFVLSGKLNSIQHILNNAKTEGAIHARMLPASCPYHSVFIREASSEFAKLVNGIQINPSCIPIISCIDQREFTDIAEIRIELTNNLTTPLNWHATVLKLQQKGMQLFYECGPGISLYKLNKFIPGGYRRLKFHQYDLI